MEVFFFLDYGCGQIMWTYRMHAIFISSSFKMMPTSRSSEFGLLYSSSVLLVLEQMVLTFACALANRTSNTI